MTLEDLPPGRCLGVVYHWSAGRYSTWFPHYHVCILGPPQDGRVLITHPFQNNLRQIKAGDTYAAHTLKRNSYRLAVSVMAMYGATMGNPGAFPVTPRQIEAICAVGGLIVARYNLVVTTQVRTHYEWAVDDGYYPNRWDLMGLGETLRGKTRYYANLAR
jgi:hypothetical protein